MAAPGARRCLAALVLGGARLLGSQALYLEGMLPARPEFAEYIGKFCFDYRKHQHQIVGTLKTHVRWDANLSQVPRQGKLQIMLFDDEKMHWVTARRTWETSTCEEKRQQASFVIDIDIYSIKNMHHDFTTYVSGHIRPRFWYITVVACGIPAHTQMQYSLHATNDVWGWQKEFSFHRAGLLPFVAVLTGAFLTATAATLCATRRSGVPQGHPYCRLLLALCVASSASCCLLLAHYAAFAKDGRGSRALLIAAIAAVALANCTMFLIAALSSLGWTISGTVLQCRARLFCALACLGVATAICEVHNEITFDESSRLFAHDTPAGIVVMIMKASLFAWVLWQMRSTYEKEWEARQRNFYWAFSVSFACWSVSAPVIGILAFNLEPWYRFKVVTVLELVARLLGLMLLARLFCGPLSPMFREKLAPQQEGAEMGPSTVGLRQGLVL